MKSITILGATGSIGSQALDLVAQFPDHFRIRALTARTNVTTLARQVARFRPAMAAVYDVAHARQLKAMLPSTSRVEIVYGQDGYVEAATDAQTDMVLSAMVGAAGLVPTLAAIEAGKDIALANKETLVMAGGLVVDRISRQGVKLMPVDSEHSAIFQSMMGHTDNRAREILLTASGGPFLNRPERTFDTITPDDALRHPNWNMGHKISIDSATLMNKGLEVIEAHWLFGMPFGRIKVVVHPQSIVHSMVVYEDGAVLAQMGVPDMKGAIAYGLSHPQRLPLDIPAPDFTRIGQLTFEEPDQRRFPCLALAYRAGEAGGTLPAVLNAANEVAVSAFLDRRLPFSGIHAVIEETMNDHQPMQGTDLDQILAADHWAREQARTLIRQRER